MSEQRKLATIMAVDVAGYSRAAEADESAAADAVRHLRTAIETTIAPLGGRIFNSAGDGFMIELPTASAGVEAATQLLAAPDAPKVRIGLHLGEVIVSESGDLLGHGVNVAARLQQMAEPGSAVVSQAVQAQIHSSRVKLAPLGKVQLDKMHDRIDVFALSPDKKRSFRRVFWRRTRRALIALLMIGVLGVGGYAAWRTFGSQQTSEAPRLAVLRFETLGETEPYFTETLADELIAYASRMEGLDVIGRTSSFSLEGARATPQVAASELDATLVLTGSVRRTGDRVRVTAQLAEAPSGRQMWTEEFERPVSEVYLLQHEIAARVAVAAGLRANAPQARRVDPRAYELYVRGREANLGDPQAAVALYEQAVALDPEFATAWARLADARRSVVYRRWVRTPNTPVDPSWISSALSAADRAIALDPGASLPYEVRSRSFALLGRWADALEASERAAERGGGAADVYLTLGYNRRAATLARRVIERDPLDARGWGRLGTACQNAQDLACNVEANERYYRLAPDEAPYFLVIALNRAGRSAEALELTRRQAQAWREFLDRPDVRPLDMPLLRAMLGEGEPPPSANLLASLEGGADKLQVIQILVELNRGEDAAQVLPRWMSADRPGLQYLYDYQLAPMRARPEFWDLMEREGSAQLWRESGEWPDFCERERAVCEAHLRRQYRARPSDRSGP
jgi:adenylate cyclase